MQLHQVVYRWGYRKLDERAKARRRALQDPEWQAVVAARAPLLAQQKTVVPTPTPFSPMR